MAPKHPPSPSSSGSESGSSSASSSSSDEEEQQQQQAQSTPPSKKPLPKKPSAAPSPSPATMPAVKPSSSSRPNNSDSGTEDDDDDDDEEEDEEEGGSDDSGSPPKPPPAAAAAAAAAAKPEKPKPKEAAALAAKPPPSESESESDESDSDAKPPPPPRRPSRGPDPSIKPISSKPMDETPKSKKAAVAAPASSDKPKATPASEPDTKKRKRKELSEVAEEEEAAANGASGKRPFQRVWTEEDEIAVLKGIIEFQANHGGADPASAIDAFHEFIYKSLHLEFSKGQISDKMRRLKKKYETNMRRGKKGADPSFAKPHEQAAFELSKKIWAGKRSPVEDGGDDMEVENVEEEGGKKGRQRGRAPAVVASPRRGKSGPAVSRCSLLGDGEDGERRAGALYPKLKDAVALLESENVEILLRGSLWKALELLKPARAKALEETWNKHFMAGMKYVLERTALKKDLLKSLVESLDNA